MLLTLNKLLKGLAALSEAYSDAIERIDGQLAEDRSLARRTISWVSYAQRPLTTEELCCVLAIEPGDRILSGDNVHDVEDIISVCAGLVTIDEESNFIRLVHYTTQEYFERIRLDWNPNAQKEIASTCLTYLAFNTFRSASCRSDKDFEEMLRKNTFLDYAAEYWAEHVRPVEVTVSELALAFLQDDGLVSCITQIMSVNRHMYKRYGQGFPLATTGLHLSARFGLVLLSRMLLAADFGDSSVDVDSKDTNGRTPLSYAASNGHEAVVKLLVDRDDVEADLKDTDGQTPLSYAAQSGHKAVVKLLVDRDDVKADSKNTYDQTPLSFAASNGHEAVVKLLVDRDDVEADSKNDHSLTPLSLAAASGHKAIVKLLVDRDDVKADSKDSIFGRTPLSFAALNGHDAVVQLLIERDDVEADSKDYTGWTPLSWAATGGCKAVVKLLVDRDNVKADSKDSKGRTPLWYAAANGRDAVVKLLVDRHDVEADSNDTDGRSALSYVAERCDELVVKLLVDRDDVEADSKDKQGGTPLARAAARGRGGREAAGRSA